MRKKSTNLLKLRAGRYANAQIHQHLMGIAPNLGINLNKHTIRYASSSTNKPVEFIPLLNGIDNKKTDDILNISKEKYTVYPYGTRLDINRHSFPLMVSIEDVVPKTTSRQLTFLSNGGGTLHYGKQGIAPSAKTTPEQLLTEQIPLEKNTLGIINMQQHVPFLIKTPEKSRSLIILGNEIVPVLPHEENIKRSSLDNVVNLDPDISKILTLELQMKTYKDKNRENFYEEITSKVDKPTFTNQSSGTLMLFEGADDTTAYHYHPGERRLHLITTIKPSGVILNFCGINESPDKRKDTEVAIPFPKNSISVLKFPAFTHHKFYGEFVCQSVHPKEGSNLIEQVNSGKIIEQGFLEYATVFSKMPGDVASSKIDGNTWKVRTTQKQQITSLHKDLV